MKKSFTRVSKRMLSIALCVFMLATTFCFFDIGSVISEALVTTTGNNINEASTSNGFSTYAINVPEIVYMSPGGTTSKYFLNNNGDGTVISGYQTEGNFSFSCATAKSVKVSAKLLTSTLGTPSNYITNITLANGSTMTGSSTSGTGQYSVTASSFSTTISSLTLNAVVTNTQFIIQWTIQYTISLASGATTYTTYAYSGVKCPNLQQAGMATYGYYDGTFTSSVEQAAYSFITGVDSVDGGNTASSFTNYSGGIAPASKIAPLVNFSGSADGNNYTMPTGTSVISGTEYFPSQSDGGVYKFYDNTSRTKIWYVDGDSSNIYDPSASTFGSSSYGNANITLDSSRFTNFNQVPFLSCGYAQFYHHWEGGGNWLQNIRNFTYTTSDATSYFRNDRSTDTESSSIAKPRANTLYCSVSRADEGSTTDNRSWVRGLYTINGTIPSSSGNTYMRYEYTNAYNPTFGDKEYYSEVAAVQFTWTLANKATLRSYYYQCLNSGVNDAASNWSTYLTNLQDIAKKLCVMTNTTTSATNPASTISTAKANLQTTMVGVTSEPVAFYVPEAAYLVPNNMSWIAETSSPFQYFINNNVNTSNITADPTPSASKSTSTSVYFAYANTSNVTIQYRFVQKGNPSVPYLSGKFNSVSAASAPATLANNQALNGNGFFSATYSASNCMSPTLAASETGFYIEWTATYTDSADGLTKTMLAYTYVYKPYVVPVIAGVSIKNSNKYDCDNSQLTWMSGFQSITELSSSAFSSANPNGSSGEVRSYFVAYPRYAQNNQARGAMGFISSDRTAIINGMTLADAGVVSNFGGSYTAASSNSSRGYLLFASRSDNSSDTMSYFNRTGIGDIFAENWMSTTKNTNPVSSSVTTFDKCSASNIYYKCNDDSLTVINQTTAQGNMYIDTSRYTNLAQVPNLGIGLMTTDNKDTATSDNGAWVVADATGKTYNNGYSGCWSDSSASRIRESFSDFNYAIAQQGTPDNRDSTYDSCNVKYCGAWDRSILAGDANTHVKIYQFHTAFMNNQSGDWISTMARIKLNATQYDKGALRQAVETARKNFAVLGIYDNVNMRSYYYAGSTYNSFVAAYKAACQGLTLLDGEVNISSLTGNLTSTLNSLLNGADLKTGTAKQYNVGLYRNPDGTVKIVPIEGADQYSKTVAGNSTVSFTPDNYTGYTYAGAVKSTNDITLSNILNKQVASLDSLNSAFMTSSNTKDSTVSAGTTVAIMRNSTQAQAPIISGGDITYENAGSNATALNYYFIYFYYVNGYHTYFDLNDGASMPNLLGFSKYNSANGGYFENLSTTLNGITMTYDPETSIITLNGTATGNGINPLSSFPMKDVLTEGNYTFKFTYVSGSKTVDSTGNSTVTIDARSMPGCTTISPRLSADQTSTTSNQIYAKSVTASQASDTESFDLWVWLSTSNYSAYTFNNFKLKIELVNSSNSNTNFAPCAKYTYYGDALDTMPVPERANYEFLGWYTQPAGGDRVQAMSSTPAANRTLYAHWKPATYNVLLDNELDFDKWAGDWSTWTGATYFNTLNNWVVSNNKTVNSAMSVQGTTPYTFGTPANLPGHGYVRNIKYSRSAFANGATEGYDHLRTPYFTASADGNYTVDLDYRINNYNSKKQVTSDNSDYDALGFALATTAGGVDQNTANSYRETKGCTNGFEALTLTKSLTAGESYYFNVYSYFRNDNGGNCLSYSLDICNVVVRDPSGKIVWSSNRSATTNGSGYYDYANRSVTLMPVDFDCYMQTYTTAVASRVHLTPGEKYVLIYDYKTVGLSGGASLRPFVFFTTGESSTGYSSTASCNVTVDPNETGSMAMEFTVPSDATFVEFRLSVLNSTQGYVEFSQIGIQRKAIYTDGAFNENNFLGWLMPSPITGTNFIKTTTSIIATPRMERLSDHYKSIDFGSQYTGLPVPTRDGYTFLGWYDASGNQYTSADGTPIGDRTCTTDGLKLYSRWAQNIYNIKYNQGTASSAANLPAQQAVGFDDYVTLATNTMTKNNDADEASFVISYSKGVGDSAAPSAVTSTKYNSYSPDGWSRTSGGTKYYNSGASVNHLAMENGATVNLYPSFVSTVRQRSVTLAAAATRNNTNLGTVTFNYNGSGAANTTYTAYTTYAFSGWYDAEEGGTKIGDANASYTPIRNITLYPHFTATAHSATFPTPQRDGYQFDGWYNGTTRYTSYTGADNITLTAHWIKNDYTIKYNQGTASSTVNLPSSQAAKYDENITLAINSMSRNNSAATTSFTVTFDINGGNSTVPSSQTNTKYTAYSADGWSRTPSGSRAYTSGQSVSNLTSTQNGTFNLFPYFASTTVYNPITLPAAATHADTNLGTVTFKYHDNVTAETTSTAYTTYAFAGWGTTTSGGRVGGAEESYTPDRARTLYALWTATAHSATFPSPSKTGYTFAGWYTAPTGGDLVTSYTGTDNVTYYAHWVANNYYIKYNQGQASSTTNLPAQQTAAFDAYVNLATNSMTKNNSADEDSFTVTYSKGTADSTAPAAQTNKKYTKYTADGWATSSGGNRAYTSGQSVRNLTTVHGATVNLYPAFSSQVIQKSINLAAAATKNNTNRGKITFNYNYTGSSNTELYAYDVWAFSGWYDAESGGNKLGNANAAYTPNGNKSAYPHFTSTAHSPTFPSPSRTGYTFAGWYTQPTGGSQVTSYTGTSDVTYYAQWDHIHSYTTVVTPPTCTQQGYTTYTCLCGDSYVSDYVPANGHTPSAWKMTVNPTVTHAGKMVRVCTVCGTTLDEMDVPQLIDNRVTGITLSENEIYLNVAETKTLTATVEPATALNKNVIWTSSKPEVATVADGEIRAVSPGTTVIIAKTEDSGHKDFCIVQVSAITAVNGSNVDNDNGVIYGLTSNLPNADGYLLLADDSMTLSYSRDKIGTGTEIRVMKDDEVINTYEAVIFGDVDGDSWYDGQDALFVNCLANGLLTKEQVGDSAYMAADCNHDGVIDDLDVAVLEQAGVLLANVDQTKSEEELLETESYVEYLNLIDQNPTLDEEVTDEPIEEPIVSTAKTLLDRIIVIIKAILGFVTNWLPKI